MRARVIRLFTSGGKFFADANLPEIDDALQEAALCWLKVKPRLNVSLDDSDGQAQAAQYFAKSFIREVYRKRLRRQRRGVLPSDEKREFAVLWESMNLWGYSPASPEAAAEVRIAARHMDALCADDASSPEAMDAVLRFAGDSAREAARLTGLSVSKYQRRIRGKRKATRNGDSADI